MKYITLFILIAITSGCSNQSTLTDIKQTQIKSIELQYQILQEQKITNELLKNKGKE